MTRLGQVLCFAIFMFGSPASAAEIWNCTVHSMLAPGATELSAGHAQIKIDGDDLAWIDGAAASGLTRHYHIAVNNDVGAVAIFAQATTSPPSVTVAGLPHNLAVDMQTRLAAAVPNPLVNSYTIALNKKDGSLRTGSVGTTGVHDISTSECQLAPIPNPESPQIPK